MTKQERILNSAYMVLCGIAYVFSKKSSNRYITAYNVKNINQTTEFRIIDKSTIHLTRSSMSESNKFKSLAILERNKDELIGGYIRWENTLKRE